MSCHDTAICQMLKQVRWQLVRCAPSLGKNSSLHTVPELLISHDLRKLKEAAPLRACLLPN